MRCDLNNRRTEEQYGGRVQRFGLNGCCILHEVAMAPSGYPVARLLVSAPASPPTLRIRPVANSICSLRLATYQSAAGAPEVRCGLTPPVICGCLCGPGPTAFPPIFPTGHIWHGTPLWSASGIVFALWPTGILILIQHFRLLCVVLAKFALCILLLESN